MHFLVDGYNVIHAIAVFEGLLDKSLLAARSGLASFSRAILSRRGDVHQITLVFDGRTEFSGLPEIPEPGLRMVFTDSDETADDRIVALLEETADRGGNTVVSNDNYVTNHARAYRCDVISAEAFHALGRDSGKKVRNKKAVADLSPDLEDEITADYAKHLGVLS